MRRVIGRMTVVVSLLASTAVGGTASAGPSGGALPPVLIEALQIGGEYGVPADAAMVAATITAIDPVENGWIKAFPCDAEPPDTANLNYAADQIANNLVLARLSTDGQLCIATRSLTDYVVDVAGYVPASSTITPLPSPVRALDTRNGTGGSNPSPVPDGGTVELVLADAHGIPKTASLAVFNLTAVGGPTGGRITAHPCDEAPGTTSSVNFPAGRNVANLVVSRLSADGAVCLLAKNASDMVVDIAGYATDGITTLPTPRRVLDTRSRGGVLDAEASVTVDPGLSGDATAAIYNLTAVDAPSRGFATAHPCDEARPTSSNLNFDGPQAVGAGSITKLDTDGTFCLFAKSPVNLIVDLIGYTTDAATYVPMSPVRIKDTREGWQLECDRAIVSGFDAWSVWDRTNDRLDELTIPVDRSLLGSAHLTSSCTEAVVRSVDALWSVTLTTLEVERLVDLTHGDVLVDVFDDGTIAVWNFLSGVVRDPTSGAEIGTFDSDLIVDAVQFSDDGRIATYRTRESNDDPGSAVSIDTLTGATMGELALAASHQMPSLSPDGALLAMLDPTHLSVVRVTTLSGLHVHDIDIGAARFRGWASDRSLLLRDSVVPLFGEAEPFPAAVQSELRWSGASVWVR